MMMMIIMMIGLKYFTCFSVWKSHEVFSTTAVYVFTCRLHASVWEDGERERERERGRERERERDGGHLQKLHVGGRGRSGRIGRQHSASLSHKLSTDVLTEFHQQEGIHFQVTTLTMPGVIQIVCFLEIDEQHFIA